MEGMRAHDKSGLGGMLWLGTAWSVLRRGCGNAVIITTAFKVFCFEGEQRKQEGNLKSILGSFEVF